MNKKLLTIVTLLSILFGPLLSATNAYATEGEESPSETSELTLVIHKLIWDSESVGTELISHDGSPLTTLPAGAQALAGAQFEYWKVTADEYKTLMAVLEGSTSKTGIFPNNKTRTGVLTTKTDGTATINLSKGYYWFNEIEDDSMDAYLATSFGVISPFIQESTVDGKVVLTPLSTLHVYPKNASTTTVEKTVGDLTNNVSPYNVGDTITYYLETRIPAGTLDEFKLVDTISAGLDYVADSAKYYIVNGPVSEVSELENGTVISSVPEGKSWTFDLTTVANTLANKGSYIYVSYDAKINEEAVKPNELNKNEVDLIYKRNGEENKKESYSNVYTGGKKFIKHDRSTAEGLAGATFVVKDGPGTNAKYFHEENGWVATKDEATTYKSDSNGQFEVTGLKYGQPGQEPANATAATYYLVETAAPEGYIIPQVLKDGLDFTVDYNSYTERATELTVQSPTGTIVNNVAKPTIPQTGGIGSIIFIAGGALLIGLAIVGLRKRRMS